MYCVPAVEGASVAPESATVGVALSTSMVVAVFAPAFRPAASCALARSWCAPFANWVVCTIVFRPPALAASHWCQAEVSAGNDWLATSCPSTEAESEHTPEGESPLMSNGQSPRTHPCWTQSLPFRRVGAVVSATSRLTPNTAISLLPCVHGLAPQTSCKPK